jgi:hypothetical protein
MNYPTYLDKDELQHRHSSTDTQGNKENYFPTGEAILTLKEKLIMFRQRSYLVVFTPSPKHGLVTQSGLLALGKKAELRDS